MLGISRWAFLALFSIGGTAVPCIPDGGSTTIDYPAPKPEIDFDGGGGRLGGGLDRVVPVDWEYSKVDAPTAWEADPISADDPMGDGGPLPGDRVGVTVENRGGKLYGPNGDCQNCALGEGKCIEMYMKVVVKIRITIHAEASFKPGGIGGGGGGSLDVWAYVTLRTDKKKICPC